MNARTHLKWSVLELTDVRTQEVVTSASAELGIPGVAPPVKVHFWTYPGVTCIKVNIHDLVSTL